MGEIVKHSEKVEQVKGWLRSMEDVIARDLPAKLKHNAKKLQGGFYACATRDPKVLEAVLNHPQMARECLLTAAAMGWSMGTTMQADCHLLAFRDRNEGLVPTLIPNYRGIQRLAYQSALVLSIEANVAVIGDEFDYAIGTGAFVKHRLGPNRGNIQPKDVTHAWAVVSLRDGGAIVEVMTIDEINTIRAACPGRDATAWAHHFGEQAKKTVTKRALKKAPRTEELGFILEIDGQGEAGIVQNLRARPGGPEEREIEAEVTKPSDAGGEEGIHDAAHQANGQQQQRQQQSKPSARSGPGMASDAQRRAMFAIGKALGLSDPDRDALVGALTGKAGIDDEALTSADAKTVIDRMKEAEQHGVDRVLAIVREWKSEGVRQ